MTQDIRDKLHISHNDIIGLNFIRKQDTHVFRKYYKQGLRSQIMEVLASRDVLKQDAGEIINGIRHYPWARPKKILRIFRTKFESTEQIFDEITKYKIIEQYLPQDAYSKSSEFIVDYIREGNRDVILCGLQDFIDGKVLNPWDLFQKKYLENLFSSMQQEGRKPSKMTSDQFIGRLRKQASTFIKSLKKMMLETGYLPDLAGIGNLIITFSGNIKLVDINNITKVSFGPEIRLDDKGYPVCDKSIEALSIMEQMLLGRVIDKTEKPYEIFLAPQRMKAVKDLEEKFHGSLKSTLLYPK